MSIFGCTFFLLPDLFSLFLTVYYGAGVTNVGFSEKMNNHHLHITPGFMISSINNIPSGRKVTVVVVVEREPMV